jgi:glycosyltransferase involved in cell wall biosynthesis
MSEADTLVSIIVPCYNYAQYLPEALDSVVAQTYQNWECIIVNDGSPDNTEEVALKYCKKDPRFKYFRKENGGHSSARNFGIRNSSGLFILPLDADDYISEVYLEKASKILENDENVKLVTGQVQLFGDSSKTISISFDLRSFLIVNYITISSVFRRSDYNKTNGFDETMMAFEDWDFFINILKNGGRVVELPLTGLFYRKKDKSIFSDFLKNEELIFRDQLRLYNNHKNIYEKYFGSPIQLIQENEKMIRVIKAYQQTRTYRMGLRFSKVKDFFSKK